MSNRKSTSDDTFNAESASLLSSRSTVSSEESLRLDTGGHTARSPPSTSSPPPRSLQPPYRQRQPQQQPGFLMPDRRDPGAKSVSGSSRAGRHHAAKVERKSSATQTDSERTKMSSAFDILEKMTLSAVANQRSKLLRKLSGDATPVPPPPPPPTSPPSTLAPPRTVQHSDEDGQGCSYSFGGKGPPGERPLEYLDSSPKASPSRKGSLLEGYWKLTASENWDEFLKKAGVGVVLRTLSKDMTTYEKITRSGNSWHIEMMSPFRNFESAFCLNQEFEEENFDGRRIKAIAFMTKPRKELTIVQTALEKDGLALTIVRRLLNSDDMLVIVTITSESGNGTVSKRYFTRTTEVV